MDNSDTRRLWNANAPAWTELSRAGFDVYRDLVNTPAFFELLPSVAGLLCLDLGCGEGYNTRMLAEAGANVIGLDVAEVFIEAAVRGAGKILSTSSATGAPCLSGRRVLTWSPRL